MIFVGITRHGDLEMSLIRSNSRELGALMHIRHVQSALVGNL